MLKGGLTKKKDMLKGVDKKKDALKGWNPQRNFIGFLKLLFVKAVSIYTKKV